MTNLLPCPFCGSENLIVVTSNPLKILTQYQIYCQDCYASGPLETEHNYKKAWNKRL